MSIVSPTAEYWIDTLQLTSHVEGGAFRQVYQSPLKIAADALPQKFNGNRHICTHIYFLLKHDQFSAFHRIASDEIWHFYFGDPLIVYEIDVKGQLTEHILGNDPQAGTTFQTVIKAGSWFGARVAQDGNYSLVGCTVSPGFDFAEFELADRNELSKLFPQHKSLIGQLTRLLPS